MYWSEEDMGSRIWLWPQSFEVTKGHPGGDGESGWGSRKRLEPGVTALPKWTQLIVLRRPRNGFPEGSP